MSRCALVGVAVLALGATPAVAGDDAGDKGPDRDRLRAFTDGKGHVVALSPLPAGSTRKNVDMFYGTSKELFRVDVQDGWEAGVTIADERVRSVDLLILDPRLDSQLKLDGATLTISCGERSTPLRELPAADVKKLASKATFRGQRFARMPVLLARNDDTTYYYVDVQPRPGNDFNIYAGKRGAMSRLKVTDIADDVAGLVLVTPKGTLRVMSPKKQGDARGMSWIPARKTRKDAIDLVEVPLGVGTTRLIFNELGPYIGQRIGLPCDDM